MISAKNSGEQERHHRQLEDIARGNGISNEGVERSMTDRAGFLVRNERSDLHIEKSMTDDELIHSRLNFLQVKDLVYQSKLYIALSFSNSSIK